MAAKKKSGKKIVSKAKAAVQPQVKAAKKTVQKTVKKTAKKAVKEAQGLLGKLAQKSAQLIIDSGLLGEAPKRPAAKKRKSKA